MRSRGFDRRRFLLALSTCVFGQPSLAAAQAAARIKLAVWQTGKATPGAAESLRQALRAHGFDETNLQIEIVFTEGRLDRIDEQARQLVAMKPNAIFTAFSFRVRALQAVTRSVPVVFFMAADPLEAGVVADYASPGGNVTGAAMLYRETAVKRLELARELLPKAIRAGLVADYPMIRRTSPGFFEHLEKTAGLLGLEVVHADASAGFHGALTHALRARVDAILPFGVIEGVPDAMEQLRDFQLRHGVPLIAGFRDEGGLAWFGTDMRDHYRRALDILARVLRGADPGRIPVDRASRFTLGVDRGLARRLRIAIPDSLRVRADVVVD